MTLLRLGSQAAFLGLCAACGGRIAEAEPQLGSEVPGAPVPPRPDDPEPPDDNPEPREPPPSSDCAAPCEGGVAEAEGMVSELLALWERCFALSQEPGSTGRAEARFEVAPDGTVCDLELDTAGLAKDVERCLADAADGARFAPTGGRCGVVQASRGFGAAGTPSMKQPTVSPGRLTVSGRVPTEVIRQFASAAFPRFLACYEPALRGSPGLAGTVVANFIIDQDGAVSHLSDGGSSLRRSVVDCVFDVWESLTFQPPEGGIVQVTFPLEFAVR